MRRFWGCRGGLHDGRAGPLRMRTGMHWTVDGAKALIAVYCSVMGRRYEDYGKRHLEAA